MKLEDKIRNAVQAALVELRSKPSLTRLAEPSVQEIKTRTKAGNEVKASGDVGPFKPLAKATVEKRKRAKNLSRETTPSTSNQVRTGKMVNSTGIRKVSATSVTIGLPKTQEKKLADNQKLERNFLKLSTKNVEDIAMRVANALADLIRRKL